MKRNSLKVRYGKLTKKHPFASLFVSVQALMMIDYAVSALMHILFGYRYGTGYTEKSLTFLQNCGYIRLSEFPFPYLFCSQDTHTYINPFIRAVLWGVELSSVGCAFISGMILLVLLISALRGKRDNVDRATVAKLAVSFTAFVAFLWIRYSVMQ